MINISYRDTTIDYIILIAILLSGMSGGMVKLQRISGDSRDPIIAQAHNDNECGGPGAWTPDLSPPVLWLCLATGPRPVTGVTLTSVPSPRCASVVPTTRRNVADVVIVDNDKEVV